MKCAANVVDCNDTVPAVFAGILDDHHVIQNQLEEQV